MEQQQKLVNATKPTTTQTTKTLSSTLTNLRFMNKNKNNNNNHSNTNFNNKYKKIIHKKEEQDEKSQTNNSTVNNSTINNNLKNHESEQWSYYDKNNNNLNNSTNLVEIDNDSIYSYLFINNQQTQTQAIINQTLQKSKKLYNNNNEDNTINNFLKNENFRNGKLKFGSYLQKEDEKFKREQQQLNENELINRLKRKEKESGKENLKKKMK